MRKVISFILTFVLILSLTACGHKGKNVQVLYGGEGSIETSSKEEITEETEMNEETINDYVEKNIIRAEKFIDGNAFIRFSKMGEKSSVGAVDKDGKLVFMTPHEKNMKLVCSSGKTVCYRYTDDNNVTVYEASDLTGNVFASSKDGVFDKILACSNDMILVYKNDSNIDKVSHLVGAVDLNGQKVGEFFQFDNGDNNELRSYFKENSYNLENGSFLFLDYIITPKQGRFYKLNGIWEDFWGRGYDNWSWECVGDTVYFTSHDGYIEYLDDSETSKSIEQAFSYSSDGTIKQIDYQGRILNGAFVLNDSENSKLTITDCQTDKKSAFTKYSATEVTAADENFFLKVNGADGKEYGLVIDRDANIVCQPIADISYLGENKVYTENDDVYTIMNFSGNTLFTISDCCFENNLYSDGLLWVNGDSGGHFAIDVNGNKVIS